jgi:hypothetical protein
MSKNDPELVDNVNKIREIIFGSQMRSYEQRFEELENALTLEISRMKNELDLRLDSLEKLVRNEIDDTGDLIQKEKRERVEALENFNKFWQDMTKGLSENVGNIEDKVTKTTSILRNEMHQQSVEWSQSLTKEIEGLGVRLANEMNVLRSDKLARNDLGDLLGEVALRLKDAHLQLPRMK